MEMVIVVPQSKYIPAEYALKCASIPYEYKSILCKDDKCEFVEDFIVADVPTLAHYFDLIDGLRDFMHIQAEPRPKDTPTQSSWRFDVVNKDDLKYYKMPQLWLS